MENSSLKAKRIATIPRSMVCTPEYFASVGGITDLADLNRCSWVGRKNPAVLPMLYSSSGEMHTISNQPQFIQVNNVEAIRAFVLSHNGVGLFSDMLIEQELAEGTLIRLLSEWRTENMHLYAVWSAQRTTGQLVMKFVEFLSKELSDL